MKLHLAGQEFMSRRLVDVSVVGIISTASAPERTLYIAGILTHRGVVVDFVTNLLQQTKLLGLGSWQTVGNAVVERAELLVSPEIVE